MVGRVKKQQNDIKELQKNNGVNPMRKGGKNGIIYDAKIHPHLIKKMLNDGMTNIKIAENIGISEKQLYEWKKKYPEIAEILEQQEIRLGAISKYDNEHHPKLLKYLKHVGFSVEQICTELNINADTYYEWIKKHAEFKAASQVQKSSIDCEVIDIMMKKIRGYQTQEEKITYEYMPDPNDSTKFVEIPVRKEVMKKEVPPDSNAIKSWFTNRDPLNWTEKGRELTINIKHQKPMTEEQQKIKEIVDKLQSDEKVYIDKLISKIPPEIWLKWSRTGDALEIAQYIANNNIEVQ